MEVDKAMNRNHFGDGKYIFFKKSITTHNSNSLRYAKNIRVYLEGAKYVQAGTAEFQRNMRVHVHKARTGLKIQIQTFKHLTISFTKTYSIRCSSSERFKKGSFKPLCTFCIYSQPDVVHRIYYSFYCAIYSGFNTTI